MVIRDGPNRWRGLGSTATFSAQAREWLNSSGVTLGRFVWARGARYLYFEGASDHLRNLWRVEVDERSSSWIGVPERLTTSSAGQDRDLVLSGDGRHLAFVSRTDETRLWSFPLARTGMVAGEGQPITGGDGSDLQAALASHGDRIVYQSVRRGGYSELRSLSLLDRREHVLTSGTDQIEHVIWSHDGQRVGYWTQRRGSGVARDSGTHSEFVVLNPAGGTETQVRPDRDAIRFPAIRLGVGRSNHPRDVRSAGGGLFSRFVDAGSFSGDCGKRSSFQSFSGALFTGRAVDCVLRARHQRGWQVTVVCSAGIWRHMDSDHRRAGVR